MFYKIVINNHKKLLHLLKLKRYLKNMTKNHTLIFKVLKSIIYLNLQLDLVMNTFVLILDFK